MTRQLPPRATAPWHRQFWPWFLIALPACVVVASVLTFFIANRGADDLVVDEYYKDGLAINRRLEKEQRAQALGLAANLHFTGDAVRLTLAGPATDAELRLSLAHPLEADRDFTTTLTRTAQGSYRGTLTEPIAPHWYWTLEPQHEGDWRLRGTVQAGDIDDAGGG